MMPSAGAYLLISTWLGARSAGNTGHLHIALASVTVSVMLCNQPGIDSASFSPLGVGVPPHCCKSLERSSTQRAACAGWWIASIARACSSLSNSPGSTHTSGAGQRTAQPRRRVVGRCVTGIGTLAAVVLAGTSFPDGAGVDDLTGLSLPAARFSALTAWSKERTSMLHFTLRWVIAAMPQLYACSA